MKEYDPPTTLLEASSFISKDSLVFYYNNQYEIVRPECAEIFRFIKIDSITAKFVGKFIDFQCDSIIIAEGSYANGVKDGLYKLYYLDGQIKESGLYKDGEKTGLWEYWYGNGTMKQKLDYSNLKFKVIDFWDDSGKKRVSNGKGYYKIRINTLLTGAYTIEGSIVDGYQEGKWKRLISQSVSYSETFKQGKLIEGKHKYLYGVESYSDTTYCSIEEKESLINSDKFIQGQCLFENLNGLAKITPPEFPGGVIGFRSFIAQHLSYPESAAEKGIQGCVYIRFIIEADGLISNVVVLTSICQSLDLEAIRVIKSSPKWKPCLVRGKPARASYTFPITFVLQE